jgi:TatD DNase family protein
MIDTHTHIYMPEFDTEGQEVGSCYGQCETADRAVQAGVDMMILPNVDLSTIEPMRALHSKRPRCTAMAMGLHPTEVRDTWRSDLKAVTDELETHLSDYCAVGEVGIDLYWDKTFADEQMQALDIQAGKATALGLPIIIHCREGLAQTLEVLQGHPDARAIFHSFGGTTDDVEAIRRHGDHYFGINGIVTFKNSRLAEVLPAIGAQRILTETDSPYLAPTPHRGRRNESAYIPLIVAAIARGLGISPDEAAETTTYNSKMIFNL